MEAYDLRATVTTGPSQVEGLLTPVAADPAMMSAMA